MGVIAEKLFKSTGPVNNRLFLRDGAFHDWYSFVLSFPPHLVQQYLRRFSLSNGETVLDPFCGTGTTLVEAKENLISSIGIEASPMASFASKVKTNWTKNFLQLRQAGETVVEKAIQSYSQPGQPFLKFNPEQEKIILSDSISELPLHKCLILLNKVQAIADLEIRDLLLLAFAHVAVSSASNLKFGPEVGVRKKKKEDATVFEDFYHKVSTMARDLELVANNPTTPSTVITGDSRQVNLTIPEASIDAVITSPPYPNEKDYTRTTRLESVLLGFLKNKNDLKRLKQALLRSNTRNVYAKDSDDALILAGCTIDRIAKEIERRRIALKKTSGFERLYHRVTRLYFGGMKRHFQELQRFLRPGAKLAYVVGDQASYLQVMIRTGELLAEIAHEMGYDVIDLDLFRTRISTTTGQQLREEVLVLEWKGKRKGKIVKESKSRYDKLIEKVFFNHYTPDASELSFDREEFEPVAKELGIKLPKNLGDIVYSFRYRNSLPESIIRLLGEGEEWIIRSIGRGQYRFVKSPIHRISPNPRLEKIKVLDATPEIIRRYALNDEQALLAILQYNRLIDIFLGITCYSLQSHLRTTVAEMGQVETDGLYVGISKPGTQYIVPVQVKGKSDEIGIVQIEQDFAVCESKFSELVCRPVAAKLMEDDLIALFEFVKSENEISIKEEKHYRLVPNEDLSSSEIQNYRNT
ncbi:MAG: hypothetical protein JXA81_14705 [Sedimentisphaerales bacterium]|nr:hypothetical protein [Sedimentisphaerales bacterium]